MSDENKYDIVKKLYDQGNYILALHQLESYATVDGFADEDFAWAGWCHYRLGNLAEAVEVLHRGTGNNQWGLLCMAYLQADCRSPNTSKTGALETLVKITDLVAIARAFIDFTRDQNNIFWKCYEAAAERVLTLTPSVFQLSGIDAVAVGQLFFETAKMYAENPRNNSDLVLALGFLDMAHLKYEAGPWLASISNAHQRAEVLNLSSRIYEQLGDIVSAAERANNESQAWDDARVARVIVHDLANRNCRRALANHERLVGLLPTSP